MDGQRDRLSAGGRRHPSARHTPSRRMRIHSIRVASSHPFAIVAAEMATGRVGRCRIGRCGPLAQPPTGQPRRPDHWDWPVDQSQITPKENGQQRSRASQSSSQHNRTTRARPSPLIALVEWTAKKALRRVAAAPSIIQKTATNIRYGGRSSTAANYSLCPMPYACSCNRERI